MKTIAKTIIEARRCHDISLKTESIDVKCRRAAEWLTHFQKMEATEIRKENGIIQPEAGIDPRGFRLIAAKMAASYRKDIVATQKKIAEFALAAKI